METTRKFRESRFTHTIKEGKHKGTSFLEILDSGGSTFFYEFDGVTYPAKSMKAMAQIIALFKTP